MLDLSLEEKIAKSQEVIKEALKKYPKVGLGFSGGTDSLVLLHLALPIIPEDTPIIFVDTQHEFLETYEFIEKIRKDWNLKKFFTVKAEQDKLRTVANIAQGGQV